ncbi:hypothetical protein EGW08_002379 [Elysia chlorotica]|uniref:Uncharacterized protein n=1 Tax=Elysia chlorotica TaxID=188477 RepID=A0A433U7M7_ELYCH|nr:hypothetical protein EGW08_002379 [Elysia chlorotica]
MHTYTPTKVNEIETLPSYNKENENKENESVVLIELMFLGERDQVVERWSANWEVPVSESTIGEYCICPILFPFRWVGVSLMCPAETGIRVSPHPLGCGST